jgi:hypothetical protein
MMLLVLLVGAFMHATAQVDHQRAVVCLSLCHTIFNKPDLVPNV